MDIEFDEDGSLKLPEGIKKELSVLDNQIPDHVHVLRLIDELDYPVGRKLLAEVLRGESTSRIKRLSLDSSLGFGALDLYDYRDIYDLVDKMVLNGLIEISKLPQNKFMPVIMLTAKGRTELSNPDETGSTLETFSTCIKKITEITEEDKKIFSNLDFFLGKYNDEQKKAIIDNSQRILCIAGAGSGKTTVLTKRIEFLVRYRNSDPAKILALTFSRKARQEMITRLSKLIPESAHLVQVETFNSFCEKILKKNADIAYDKEYRVMDYQAKIKIVNEALGQIGWGIDDALSEYFSKKRFYRENKRDLYFTFVNDMFSLMDHYKHNEKSISFVKDISNNTSTASERRLGEFIYKLISTISDLKKEKGLRDYTDQITHSIELFEKNPDSIPEFEHILVDEYQDVNNIQVKLIDILDPKNLFVVGDPRQSIYGWRGSKIENILNFPNKYGNPSVIQLTKNYRSTEKIVEIGNKVIKSMGLPGLETPSGKEDQTCPIMLVSHSDENAESLFVAQSILSQNIPRNEIFVLARTNKQLENISRILQQNSIKFLKRTVEEKKENLVPKEDEVTLSTVHAIKGLEAEIVYMIGVSSQMYPCMASEHPFLNLVKVDDEYDKYAEELRLLYVGLTRAKKQLVISYYNTLSRFITSDVLSFLTKVGDASLSGAVSSRCLKRSSSNDKDVPLYKQNKKGSSSDNDLFFRLKDWRLETANKKRIRAYMIFSDKTLQEIVSKKPSSFYELQSIYGLGDNKILKYGSDILEIINKG